MLGLGQVEQAISAARQSVRIAERSGKKFLIICARVVFAETLLAYGKFIEAQNRLKEAELIQAELQPEYPILYSFQGFHYCDLLFEQGQSEEVIRRATHNLASAERKQVVLDIGLNHLSLGRACPPGSSQSVHHLNQAVDFLRQSGTLDMLPLGLLARGTPRDLDEVYRIATRSGMRLYLTDYHIASARVAIKNGNPAKAREHFVEAEKLVNETGYHRRDKELDQLRIQLPT